MHAGHSTRTATSISRSARYAAALAVCLGVLLCSAPAHAAGSRWAVFVGIDDYQHPRIKDLRSAENDAKVLGLVAMRRFGFPAGNIRLLVGKAATRAAIEDAVRATARAASADDVVLFFFSGHGEALSGAEAALDPWDVVPNRDPKQARMITPADLAAWLGEGPSTHCTVVLDCNHSERFAASPLGQRPGTVVLAAGTRSRESVFRLGERQAPLGVFTFELASFLVGRHARGDYRTLMTEMQRSMEQGYYGMRPAWAGAGELPVLNGPRVTRDMAQGDTAPPTIEIDEPVREVGSRDLEVEAAVPVVRVEGTARDNVEVASVTVNGKPADLSPVASRDLVVEAAAPAGATGPQAARPTGMMRFACDIPVEGNDQVVRIAAVDLAGNRAERAITIRPRAGASLPEPALPTTERGWRERLKQVGLNTSEERAVTALVAREGRGDHLSDLQREYLRLAREVAQGKISAQTFRELGRRLREQGLQ